MAGVAVMAFQTSQAQLVTNGGFENWSVQFTGSAEEPTGWVTANILKNPFVSASNPEGAFKKTTPGDYHWGAKAVELKTVKLVANPLAANDYPDTVGFMFVGSVAPGNFNLTFGTGYTSRPDSISFYYKYAPQGTDHGAVLVTLTRTVGAIKDTVGEALAMVTAATSGGFQYKAAKVVYRPNYVSSGNPDTVIVAAASSYGSYDQGYAVRPKLGSSLYLDDMEIKNIGIAESPVGIPSRTFPNPANNALNISINHDKAERYVIYDITGKEVLSGKMEHKRASVQVEQLQAGMYFYKIFDTQNSWLSGGKIQVVH